MSASSWPRAAELVPLHRSQLAQLEAAGAFPRRIRLGPSRVGWSLREVMDWIEQKKLDRQAYTDTEVRPSGRAGEKD